MRPDHHGAGRINDAHSPRLHGVQHGVLDAVRRDHERLALQVLQRAGDTDSRFLQPGDHLRIVDQRTPGVHVAGCSLRGAARHLHRALHTAAEAHVFGHENFHRSLAYYGMDRIASLRRRIAWWNVARCMSIPLNSRAAARTVLDGSRRRVDVGQVNDRYFATISGVGFDAEVAHLVNRWPRWIRGTTVYVLGILQTLITYRPVDAHI